MKKVIFALVGLAALIVILKEGSCFAQRDEIASSDTGKKSKLVMTVMDGGKPIVTELTSVNFSVSRYEDSYESEPEEAKPAEKSKNAPNVELPKAPSRRGNGMASIGIETKKLNQTMLKVLARNKTKFDGSIEMTDASTHKLIKTLKFKQASLYSYSDQISSVGYSDGYGSAVLSINCKELAVDGVNFEQ